MKKVTLVAEGALVTKHNSIRFLFVHTDMGCNGHLFARYEAMHPMPSVLHLALGAAL